MHTLGGALAALGLAFVAPASVVASAAIPLRAEGGPRTAIEEAQGATTKDGEKKADDAKEAARAEAPLPVIFLRAERVFVRPGHVLENQHVLVRNGRIVAIGSELNVPAGAQEIAAKVVCAGYIDPWSALGVDREGLTDASTTAATRTADGLDLYSLEHLRAEALRAGVTSVRVQAGSVSRIGGLGSLVRLTTDAPSNDPLLAAESNLSMSIGLGRGEATFEMQPDGTIVAGGRSVDIFDRIDALDRLVAALQAGRNYRIQHNEYRHELAEWQKKIAEKEVELDKEFKKAKKDREKAEKDATDKGKPFEEKKYKEDKKPALPRFDPDSEALARAADGEIPLIVNVNRAAEIRGLLQATESLDRLRLIVAGAADSLSSATQLAERRVPVIVAPLPLGRFRADEQDGLDPALPARLARAGVTVLLGSGGVDPAATRDLPLLAQLAIGHGLERDLAFEALTIGAARALDVSRRLGTVEVGKDADLLVLDGDPLTLAGRVRWVISGGRVVVTPEE